MVYGLVRKEPAQPCRPRTPPSVNQKRTRNREENGQPRGHNGLVWCAQLQPRGNCLVWSDLLQPRGNSLVRSYLMQPRVNGLVWNDMLQRFGHNGLVWNDLLQPRGNGLVLE